MASNQKQINRKHDVTVASQASITSTDGANNILNLHVSLKYWLYLTNLYTWKNTCVTLQYLDERKISENVDLAENNTEGV